MLRVLKGALDDFRSALRSGDGTSPVATPSAGEASTAPARPATPPAEVPPADSPAEDPPAPPARRWQRYALPASFAGGLLLAGTLFLPWTTWLTPEPADPTVVATYQGGVVTRDRLASELQAVPRERQAAYQTLVGLRALVGDVVVHEVTRRWAEERQVDQKGAFKEAMKHATEQVQIADVSDRLHEGRIQVGEADIQAYYDQNRQRFGERPLAEVREQIRRAVVEQKEGAFVEGYLKELKERASLQVDYGLLDVPERTEAELSSYYQANRERFRTAEGVRPFEEARTEIATTLRAERERQVFDERKRRTLFTIHSRRTTLGEFLQEIEELPPDQRPGDAAARRRVLDAFVERLLVVEDAAEQTAGPKSKDEVQHARTDLLARLLHQEQVEEQIKVSDEDVRAAYDRDPARYADPPRVKVRYIRVTRGRTADQDQKAEAKIEEAEAKLKPGGVLGLGGGEPADFAEIARQYSEDPATAANGGELDRWFGEESDSFSELFEHTLHQELLPLKVGEISPVLALDDGYYLFQVREKQQARTRPFEEVKDLVRRDLEARRHDELSRDMQGQLLERAQLRIYDGRLEAALAELRATPTSSR